MGDPQVFISCVSSEFRTVGRAVADVPLRLGYTSVTAGGPRPELAGRAGRQAQVVLRAFFAARTPGM